MPNRKKPETHEEQLEDLWDKVFGTRGDGLCALLPELRKEFEVLEHVVEEQGKKTDAIVLEIMGFMKTSGEDLSFLRGRLEAMTGPRVTPKDIMRWIITLGALGLATFIVWGVVSGNISAGEARGLLEAGARALP